MKPKTILKDTPYLGITIIWGIIGLAILVYSYVGMRFYYWESYVLALVPVSIFSFLIILRKRKCLNIKYLKIVNYVITSCFTILFLINAYNIVVNECTNEINDVKYYNRILRIYGYPNNELKHFPKKIPNGVSAVEFYEIPQFLQGGAQIRLSYITNEEEIKKIVDKYNDSSYKVIENYKGGHCTELGVWIPQVISDSMNSGTAKLFILSSNPGKSNGWNHGCAYGVAVDTESKRVIYWYERW